MAYQKTTWVNNGNPPISAANLNNVENGIEANDLAITQINTNIGTLENLSTNEKTNIVGAINEVVGNQKWRLYGTTNNTTQINMPTESYEEMLVVMKDVPDNLTLGISIPKLYIDTLQSQTSFQSGYWGTGSAGGRGDIIINPTTGKMFLRGYKVNDRDVSDSITYWYIR